MSSSPSCPLFDLPQNVVLVLLNHVAAVSNTGQIMRFAMASQQCMQLVSAAEWFWQQQCEYLGWLRAGVHHPACVSAPENRRIYYNQQQRHSHNNHQRRQQENHHHQQQQQQTQQGEQQLESASAAALPAVSHASPWFQYYILRMASRWRLRTLMRKYIAFLDIHSRLALQPGASVQQLAAAEERLGIKLPWEVWELYRFKAGQAFGGPVSFAGGCRLLELHELQLSGVDAPAGPSLSPSGPMQQEQQLAALQAQLPGLKVITTQLTTASSSTSSEAAGTRVQTVAPAAAAAAAAILPIPVVVFLANTMGNTSYAVAQDASVHIIRGFSQRRIAGSVSGFLQHLLT